MLINESEAWGGRTGAKTLGACGAKIEGGSNPWQLGNTRSNDVGPLNRSYEMYSRLSWLFRIRYNILDNVAMMNCNATSSFAH